MKLLFERNGIEREVDLNGFPEKTGIFPDSNEPLVSGLWINVFHVDGDEAWIRRRPEASDSIRVSFFRSDSEEKPMVVAYVGQNGATHFSSDIIAEVADRKPLRIRFVR